MVSKASDDLRAREAGDYGKFIVGNVDIYVFEIVDPCPGDGNFSYGAVVGYIYIIRFQSVVHLGLKVLNPAFERDSDDGSATRT